MAVLILLASTGIVFTNQMKQ